VFDQVLNRAVEVFNSKEFDEETEGAVSAGTAWIEAVYEMIQTDGDAVAVVVDIISDPQLKEMMYLWRSTDGDDEFKDFVREALINLSHAFEVLIIAKIENYPDVMQYRKSLAEARTSA
jgi:hypothetical protein